MTVEEIIVNELHRQVKQCGSHVTRYHVGQSAYQELKLQPRFDGFIYGPYGKVEILVSNKVK